MSYAEDLGYDAYDVMDFDPPLNGHWKTKDGKHMKIWEMDNNHLKNAYLSLKRRRVRHTAQDELLEEIRRRVCLAQQLVTAIEDFTGLYPDEETE